MTLSEYAQLKEKVKIGIVSSERHGHLLISLKELYRDTINSSRRFEGIVTIGQLLNVLEVRALLSEDDVRPLKEIAGRLPNNASLIRRIEEYQDSHVPRKYVNYYASTNEQNRKEDNKRQPTECMNTNPNILEMSALKRQRINDTLTEEIGIFWRDLGRNLKIREGDIDIIDSFNISTNRKAKKLMAVYYKDRANPQSWFFDLCDALEKTRRKNLSRSLQEIMAMNI